MRISVLATIAAVTTITAAPAGARDLETACEAVDRAGNAGCVVDRRSNPWTLTTGLLVGGGGKARVTAVEGRFCREARAEGIRGRVVRWNRMPGPASLAAKLEWLCGAAAVSTGPPARLR